MEIDREKFRVAALLIALASGGGGGGCVVHQQPASNLREEQTSWTGSAPRPTVVQPGPTYEAGYAPPYEGYAPNSEYVPIVE
jgi:hypothetical protein